MGVGTETGTGGEGGAMTLEEMNKLASEAFNSVALDICEFCGRSFLVEKLAIHNRLIVFIRITTIDVYV